MVRVGDYVTRKKYDSDIVFIVDAIKNNVVYLKGVDVRLYADSYADDLLLAPIPKKKETIVNVRNINTNDFFFIPAKILHLDSDKSYLDKCLDYYKNQNIKVFGYLSKESEYQSKIDELIEKYEPDIVVLTGHDAYYKNKKDGKYYKNSEYFINTVKEIRKKYNDIIIFAGACQSDFKGIIGAGSTFASSPNHINIHALDPAIVSSFIALTDENETIDIKELISKTHYGSDGIGGLIVKGKMLSGYPRGRE